MIPALLYLGLGAAGLLGLTFGAWHVIARAHERRCTEHVRDARWWTQCRAPFAVFAGQRCWSCYTAEPKSVMQQTRRAA